MATRRIEVIIGGDASAAQKAFRDTEQAAATAQVKVEGFGKQFAAMGAAFGAGVAVVQTVVPALQGAVAGLDAYNKSVDSSQKLILGYTKSQGDLAAAQALARREADAGNATYEQSLSAIAALTPLAGKYNVSLQDVLRTTQLLAATDPVQGFEGAKIAIQEALSGDFTSLERRFELPREAIQKLKDQGVPNLQIVQKVLADLGIDATFLATANTSAAKQTELLNGRLTELAATAGQPVFADILEAIVALNKELGKPEVAATIHGVAEELKIIIAGRLWQQFSLLALDAFTGVVGAYNSMLKALSGGRVNIDPLFDQMKANLAAAGQDLVKAANLSIGESIASAVKGTAPGSPIAPVALRGYGGDIFANIVAGMTEGQSDALQQIGKIFEGLFKDDSGKTSAAAFAQANTVLAAALHEVATTGQVSERTTDALARVYKGSSGEVLALVVAYGQLVAAQGQAAAAAQSLADAQYNLQQVQNRAKGDLAGYQQAVTDATNAAAANARAAEDAIAPLQGAIDQITRGAADSARVAQDTIRGLQADLDGLQAAANQRAAAFQAQIAQAQAAVSAASRQRQNDQALLNAALAGELEYEEQILDGLTDEQRARAAVWQAEIDGQRRAREGANQKVTNLSRAAHKEDLDFLTRIDAARASGNEKEARRLERELAARQKQRQAATQLAQAQAAVANDEFDAAEERIKKEGQAQEVKDAQAEKAAQANLTRIQAAANAQKAADDAAIAAKQAQIKGVQDQQDADARRSADAVRNIQAEIEKINDQATAQAAKDKQAIIDANTLLTNQQTYWGVVTTGAQAAVNLTGTISTNAQATETALKNAYEWEQKRYQLYKDNPPGSPGGPPTPQQVAPPSQGGGRDERAGAAQASGAPPPTPADIARAAAAGLPPLIDGARYPKPPEGYHTEYDAAGGRWYVPDGHTLAEYNQLGGTGSNKAPLGLVSAGIGGMGGPGMQFQRAAGFGGQAGGEGITIVNQIYAPNLRDVRDKRDLADLNDSIGAHAERTWRDIARGGRVKREVG